MKGKWEVSSQYIDGVKEYQVYRRINMNEVDHNGNRKYEGRIFLDKKEAKKVADEMNKQEKLLKEMKEEWR